jgi:hypothetical protein
MVFANLTSNQDALTCLGKMQASDDDDAVIQEVQTRPESRRFYLKAEERL